MNKFIIKPLTKAVDFVKNEVVSVKAVIKKEFVKLNNIQLKRKRNRLYIIGGGPSIRDIDLTRLTDGDIMCVNRSFEFMNRIDFFITMDYSFLKSKCDFENLKSKCDKTIFIVNTSNDYVIKKTNGYYIDTRFNLTYLMLDQIDIVIESKNITFPNTGFGLTYANFCNGENSGFSAIQLAILMEYQEIYLLGVDLKTQGNITHFHNGYANQSKVRFNKDLLKYRNRFDTAFSLLNTNIKKRIKSTTKDGYLNKYIDYTNINSLTMNNTPQEIFTSNKQNSFDNLIVVAYYTINTPYEQEVKKLITSIDRLGLNKHIKGIPNLGNWQKNTRAKANFLRECLDLFPDKRLLYVDADAEINSLPILCDDNFNYDIAVRWQDFPWHKDECLSGTIFLSNNRKTRMLCDLWNKFNVEEGDMVRSFEQANLGKAIEQMKKNDGLTYFNLPPEYVQFDKIEQIYPELKKGKGIIQHFQASRRLRNQISKKN